MSNLKFSFNGFCDYKSSNPIVHRDSRNAVCNIMVYGNITLKVDGIDYGGDLECLMFFNDIRRILSSILTLGKPGSGGIMEEHRQIFLGPSKSPQKIIIATDYDGIHSEKHEIDLFEFSKKLGATYLEFKRTFEHQYNFLSQDVTLSDDKIGWVYYYGISRNR